MNSDQIRLRALAQRDVVDPETLLKRLGELNAQFAVSNLPPATKRLRTAELKELREMRDACLFAYGLSRMWGVDVAVLRGEFEDYDFVTRTVFGEEVHYTCVQLKELVPEDLNPAASLEALISSLKKRPPSDAMLLVRLNRQGQIPYEALRAARVPYGELWYLWASSPDALEWSLYGDAMKEPSLFTFQYPNP